MKRKTETSTNRKPQSVRDSDEEKKRNRTYRCVLLLIILTALWLRLDDLIAWRNQPQRAFYNTQPILINFDGYYYLSLARELVSGTYGTVDSLRGIPESPPMPMPPPLLSVLAAGLAAATPLSLDWIATLMPPLLGILLAIPLVLIGRLYGGRLTAAVAAGVALFTHYYTYRTHLGWFDTDCLNVTFVLTICYLFIRFGITPERRRYTYLTGGLAAFGLFMLWWDQTPAVVTLISLSPLLIVAVLYYRPVGHERRLALVLTAVCITAVIIWLGPQIIVAPFKEALRQWGYITKQQASAFPNVGVSVFEQKRLAVSDIIQKTTGHGLTFLIGLAGLIWLFVRQTRKSAALLVPFGVGLLSVLFARRFLIFLIPFLSLGIGFAAQRLWEMRLKWHVLKYAVPALLPLAVFFPINENFRQVYWPKEIPPIVEGMDAAAMTTPEDAVIWAWWDHGYPLVYWARRGTINDGSLHGGLRTVCNAFPLMAHNPRLAANFMHFYVARGISGMQRVFGALGSPEKGMRVVRDVLDADPERVTATIRQAGLTPADEWQRFFYPSHDRKVYLFLDLRLARTSYWWSWFGTWDTGQKKGKHSSFRLFRNSRHQGQRITGPQLSADLGRGTVTYRNKTYPLGSVHIVNEAGIERKLYPHTDGLALVYRSVEKVAALMDASFAQSLFNNFYMLQQFDTAFFSLQKSRYPYYQLWQVNRTTQPH